MPTPNASTDNIIPTIINVSSPRQTCPPDEARMPDGIAELEDASGRSEGSPELADSDAHSSPTAATTMSDMNSTGNDLEKEQRLADELASSRDTASPMSVLEEQSDADHRFVQSHASSREEVALYPLGTFGSPYPKTRFLPNSTSSFLRPGSKFTGTQKSDHQVYEVQVDLKHVDMEESFLCGYLRIQGLTDDHPTLTTYFEGEIIGSKYTFQTKHPEWGSSEKVDMQHWNRFPAWRPLANAAKRPNFSYKNYAQREYLFMRWKEYFLVPDHRVRTISGASFEGFYYICFDQVRGKVSGIYFHKKSEKYQQLELEHVADNGCVGAFEFR